MEKTDKDGNMLPETPEQQSEVDQFNDTVQGQQEQAIQAGKELPRYGDLGIRCGWH